MPLIVAVWPDNTISILKMKVGYRMVDVFYWLDNEADPLDAKCYEVRRGEDCEHTTHLSFGWKDIKYSESNETIMVPRLGLLIGDGAGNARIKRLRWPADILKDFYGTKDFGRPEDMRRDK